MTQEYRTYIAARNVKEGDTLDFGHRGGVVHIERLSVSQWDGAIGLHGNDESWHAWYPPADRVPVRRKTGENSPHDHPRQDLAPHG